MRKTLVTVLTRIWPRNGLQFTFGTRYLVPSRRWIH